MSTVSCTKEHSISGIYHHMTIILYYISSISQYIRKMNYVWVVTLLVLTNLWVQGMKAPLRHIKGIASGSHCASEKIRLPFHTPKCGQGTIDNMILQDTVQLRWGPARSWLSPLISFVGKPQLVLQVLSDPFSQLGWQPAQHGVSSPVNILQPSSRGCLLIRHCQLGAWFLAKFNPAGFEKVDVQANTTPGIDRVIMHILHIV